MYRHMDRQTLAKAIKIGKKIVINQLKIKQSVLTPKGEHHQIYTSKTVYTTYAKKQWHCTFYDPRGSFAKSDEFSQVIWSYQKEDYKSAIWKKKVKEVSLPALCSVHSMFRFLGNRGPRF